MKCVVARSNENRHHLTETFISAMEGEKFVIEMDDLKLSWSQLNSKEQQIRQSKILGLWSIVHFPSLRKKLCGEMHQVPRVNADTEISVEKIDELVFSKMKLRVVKMSVSESTFNKLKHFVKVPGCVGNQRINEIKIAKKMVGFDVDTDFVDSCWDALKNGKFSDDEVSFPEEEKTSNIQTKRKIFDSSKYIQKCIHLWKPRCVKLVQWTKLAQSVITTLTVKV